MDASEGGRLYSYLIPAGIKYYLVASRGKLSTSLKPAKSTGDSMDTSSGSTFVKPNILVPRKRSATRGELQVQATLGLPPAAPRKSKKKARCSTPVNIDMTEDGPDSKFQDRLLEDGCGSQAILDTCFLSIHPTIVIAPTSFANM
jgi:hypothetical protein